MADMQVSQKAPTVTYGAATSLNADGDEPAGSGQDVYALLRFRLSDILAGSTVNSVKLIFNVTNTSYQAYNAYALTKAWDEQQATWYAYRSGSRWEVAGARGTTDRGSSVLASLTPSFSGKQAFDFNASGVAQVQGWLDGTANNNGLIIANRVNIDGFDFSSREVPDPALRPTLQVTYTPAYR